MLTIEGTASFLYVVVIFLSNCFLPIDHRLNQGPCDLAIGKCTCASDFTGDECDIDAGKNYFSTIIIDIIYN